MTAVAILGATGGIVSLIGGIWLILRSAVKTSISTRENANEIGRIGPIVTSLEIRVSVLEAVVRRNGRENRH